MILAINKKCPAKRGALLCTENLVDRCKCGCGERCAWPWCDGCARRRARWRGCDHIGRDDQQITDLNGIWICEIVLFDDVINCAVVQGRNKSKRVASLYNVIDLCAARQIRWNGSGCWEWHVWGGEQEILARENVLRGWIHAYREACRFVDSAIWIEQQYPCNSIIAKVVFLDNREKRIAILHSVIKWS